MIKRNTIKFHEQITKPESIKNFEEQRISAQKTEQNQQFLSQLEHIKNANIVLKKARELEKKYDDLTVFNK